MAHTVFCFNCGKSMSVEEAKRTYVYLPMFGLDKVKIERYYCEEHAV